MHANDLDDSEGLQLIAATDTLAVPCRAVPCRGYGNPLRNASSPMAESDGDRQPQPGGQTAEDSEKSSSAPHILVEVAIFVRQPAAAYVAQLIVRDAMTNCW